MRGSALFSLSKSFLFLLVGGACVAQTTAPAPAAKGDQAPLHIAPAVAAATQPELPLNRRIEIQLRSQYSIPPPVEITVGDVKPSEMPGFDTLPVVLKTGSRNTTLEFLLSKDKKTLAHLEKFDIAADPTAKIDLAGRPVRGNKDAKVTIINYDDFECPFCARMHQTLNNELLILYADKIRIIYKDYPLFSIHPWADHAAVDANCLNAQNGAAYWHFADFIHANQSSVTMNKDKDEKRALPEQMAELDRITLDQGKKDHLDESQLQACIKAQDDSKVIASSKEGDAMGVDSTPTMFINGEKISGAAPLEAMIPIINRALRSAGVAIPPEAEPPQAPKSEAKEKGTTEKK
jgi:protein-disulfide isomerase